MTSQETAPDRATSTSPSGFVAVRANLLPPSILQSKTAKRTRRSSLVAMAAGVLLVAGGYVAAVLVTSSAQSQLDLAQSVNSDLLAEQRALSEAAGVLGDISGIEVQLERMFTDDVSLSSFLTGLRAAVPARVEVSSANIAVPGATDESGTSTVGGSAGGLDDSGRAHLGSIDLTGSAPDAKTVEAFVARLAEVPGITVPYVVAVREGQGGEGVDFTAQATITDAVRSERFAQQDGSAE